jgi:hypothetical protein
MSLTYGYDLKKGDKIIAAPIQATEIMSPLVVPGGSLVNQLPFCTSSYFTPCCASLSQLFEVRHIPSWVPWLSYEPLAQLGRVLAERMKNEPIDFVKSAIVCGLCHPQPPTSTHKSIV